MLRSLFLAMTFAFLTNSASAKAQTSLPDPQVYSFHVTAVSGSSCIFPGEQAVIGVNAIGSTTTGSSVEAKVDIVFLIDESGSTASTDPGNLRHSTVINILNGLNPALHRAAIVVFGSTAQVLGSSALTNDFSALISALGTIPSLGVFTNIAGAMSLANDLLNVGGANHRIAILVTDGVPASASSGGGYDLAQDAEINGTHVPAAIQRDINYYVVHLFSTGLGPAPAIALLENRIAGDTFGEYFLITNATEIAARLQSIITEVSQTLVVKDASLEVKVNVGTHQYRPIDGSAVVVSGASVTVTPPDSIVTTPPVARLGDANAISVFFPVTSLSPIPPGTSATVTEASLAVFQPSARLRYHLGDGSILTKPIPQLLVNWCRPPDVLVLKRFDPLARTLTISVTNFIQSGPITKVRLYDIVGQTFEIDYLSATPKPNIISHRQDLTADRSYLFWDLDAIMPNQTKTVRFAVRYFGPVSGGVLTDSKKPEAVLTYVDPDGQFHKKDTSQPQGSVAGWEGDLQIDASLLNLSAPTSSGSDLVVVSRHIGGTPGSRLTTSPVPLSPGMWNETAPFSVGPNFVPPSPPEPLDLSSKNTVRIRVHNRGNLSTKKAVKAKLYFALAYAAHPDDWLLAAGWREIGTIKISKTPIGPGQSAVGSIVWRPDSMSPPLTPPGIFVTFPTKGFYRVVVDHDQSETRKNNNTAFLQVRVQR